ncbi:hypothetical protein F4820DRAFT_404960 [Hypoxylon rubiginosum]|uniref:Uncharacterized protein n=1 Tax=Hypoxylon rubiginosum TaxID=110542 RepID=A0ACB9ZEI4_9PEZI|nr:hypothetical protein F4820DRAFT_404960 [Hypoxylon rubiginosum]
MASRVFRTGTKQVFLPSHIITLLRPREKQPPNFASFKVPLTFNKLDLRDYLLHAYNVPVLGVRSQLTQRRPRRSKMHHRIYRPPPVKTMTVELHRPFAWPEVPEDLTAWNTPHLEKRRQVTEENEKLQKRSEKKSTFPLRDELGADEERVQLRKEAKRLLEEGNWENGKTLDPKFTQQKKKKGSPEGETGD